MTIFFVALIPIVLFSLIGGIAFYFIRKTDPKNNMPDGAESPNSNNVQGFLPIADICDGYVVMKNGKRRRVIECSSTNYDLKTEDEQVSIELLFQRFINSLTFPISFFVQTRVIDNERRLNILRDDIEQVKHRYPSLQGYADDYYNAMTQINDIIGNSLQKKKFVVVPYDEDVTMDRLSKAERDEYARKELDGRCAIVMSGLSSIGVRASVLDTEDLVDLFYSTFHRDDYGYAENLTENEAMSLIVEGDETPPDWVSTKERVLSALTGVINVMDSEYHSLEEVDFEHKELLQEMLMKYKRPTTMEAGGQ